MSRTEFNQNTRLRTDLNKSTIRTIKFKTLFPDWETWVSKLEIFGIKKEYLSESEFMIIQTMIANSWLRYKTDVKNLGHIAFVIRDLYARREKEQKLYDLDIDTLLSSVSTNEQGFYTINKSGILPDDVTDRFLDNSVRSTLTNKEPYIQRLKEIQEFNEMRLPELTYLSRLSSSIIYPLQPTQRNDKLGGQYVL